jgi:hypothetical protein
MIALFNDNASGAGNLPAVVLESGRATESVAVTTKEQHRRTLTRSFPASADTLLQFENLCGRVDLQPATKPAVEIEANIRVENLTSEAAKQLLSRIEWVETPNPDGSSHWGLSFPTDLYPKIRYPLIGDMKSSALLIRYQNHQVDVTGRDEDAVPSVECDLRISLPSHVHVAIRNAVGRIEGQHLTAPLELETHDGLIRLNDVHGPITARSVRGDILVAGMRADAELRTESGDLELRRSMVGRISLSTRSGNCRLIQPRSSDFRVTNSSRRPLAVGDVDFVNRVSTLSDGGRTELLSHGTGGPDITMFTESGNSVLEFIP